MDYLRGRYDPWRPDSSSPSRCCPPRGKNSPRAFYGLRSIHQFSSFAIEISNNFIPNALFFGIYHSHITHIMLFTPPTTLITPIWSPWPLNFVPPFSSPQSLAVYYWPNLDSAPKLPSETPSTTSDSIVPERSPPRAMVPCPPRRVSAPQRPETRTSVTSDRKTQGKW